MGGQGCSSSRSFTAIFPLSRTPVAASAIVQAWRGLTHRLRLDEDAAKLAFFEVALLLNRAEELHVVQMPFAEVPSDDDAGDHLAVEVFVVVDLIDGLGQQGLQAPAVQVHRAEREHLRDRSGERFLVEHPFELSAKTRRGSW